MLYAVSSSTVAGSTMLPHLPSYRFSDQCSPHDRSFAAIWVKMPPFLSSLIPPWIWISSLGYVRRRAIPLPSQPELARFLFGTKELTHSVIVPPFEGFERRLFPVGSISLPFLLQQISAPLPRGGECILLSSGHPNLMLEFCDASVDTAVIEEEEEVYKKILNNLKARFLSSIIDRYYER